MLGTAASSDPRHRDAEGGFTLDLAANIAGASWSVLTQVACVPFFIKFLGVEAYGLFGFYLVMQAVLQVLDLGLSPTVNREMARFSAMGEKKTNILDLVITMEVCYWLVGVVICCLMLSFAHLLATRWIRADSMPVVEVQRAVALMAVMALFQWPVSFYQGGLLGLRRQVLFNGLTICSLTFAYGGALVVLWIVNRSVSAFFTWLVLASVVRVMLLAAFFWKSVGPQRSPRRFHPRQLRGVMRFAGGVAGIAVFSIAFSQADKLIVSKVLPLRAFGYYSIASTVASALVLLIGAIFSASFPRFSALAASAPEHLDEFYHLCTQTMAATVFPPAAVLAFFSTEILRLWTRNNLVVIHAGPVTALLALGVAVSSLSYIPFGLQLAHGLTGPSFWISFFLTMTMIPAIFVLASRFGIEGAASGTILLSFGNSALQIFVTHHRLLRGATRRWFREIGRPLVVVLVVAALGRLFSSGMTSWGALTMIVATAGACFYGAFVVSPLARRGMHLGLLGRGLGFTAVPEN